LMQEGFSI